MAASQLPVKPMMAKMGDRRYRDPKSVSRRHSIAEDTLASMHHDMRSAGALNASSAPMLTAELSNPENPDKLWTAKLSASSSSAGTAPLLPTQIWLDFASGEGQQSARWLEQMGIATEVRDTFVRERKSDNTPIVVNATADARETAKQFYME